MVPGNVRRGGFIAIAGTAALIILLLPSGSRADRADFVGAKACATCHKQQYTSWTRTAHAGATSRLGKRTQRKCLACHSTGEAPAGRAFFSGVQCEACHGSGAGYRPDDVMRNKTLATELGLRDLSTPLQRAALCNSCHSAATKLKPFDVEAAWKKIKH